MTFDEWWNRDAYNQLYNPTSPHVVQKWQAQAIWSEATTEERERCAPVLRAAQELLDDVKLRYDLESDEELECEYMRSLATAIREQATTG